MPSRISSVLSQCDLSHLSCAINYLQPGHCQWAFSSSTLCEQAKPTSDAEAGKEGMREVGKHPPYKVDTAQLVLEGCCWAQGGLRGDGNPVASKHPRS